MATLKAYQYAMNGEQGQKQTGISTSEDQYVEKLRGDIDPLTQTKYHLFKLVGNTRKGSVYIPNVDDVYNPETKKVERIRLLSGFGSIWMKDQKDLTPDYIRMNSRTLVFHRGARVLRIADHDTTALEFARVCNFNIGNANRKTGSKFEFYEYDPAQMEKEELERESFGLEMALEAKLAKVEDMMKHAQFLGISLVNEFGIPKSAEGVRTEYQRYANRNPKYFKETMGSKEVDVNYLVKSALADAKIDVGKEPGKAYWANGGGMITAYAPKENPVKVLVDLALTNSKEGKQFLEQLQNSVK